MEIDSPNFWTLGRKAVKTAEAESKIMVSLDHGNIVKLYEYFTIGRPPKCYMVMELLNGRELVALICDENHFTNLTEDVLKVYVRQVTQGTEYAPNKGFLKKNQSPLINY